MNYEPFDYEKYKAGRKAVTRDGRGVTQLVRFEADIPFPLYGVLDNGLVDWSVDGKYRGDNAESDNDLFLLPEVREVWVAVVDDEDGIDITNCFIDEAHANMVLKSLKNRYKKAKLIIYS